MLQKLELQQLQALSLDDVKAYKVNANARKTELEAIKAKGGKDWTSDLQDELNDIALILVDVDDVIEQKMLEPSYTVKPGTENMVHVRIVRGRRFNPLTGKEESSSYVQMFTYGEWQLFKNTFAGLGYTILAALHDPYGDAAKLVTK